MFRFFKLFTETWDGDRKKKKIMSTTFPLFYTVKASIICSRNYSYTPEIIHANQEWIKFSLESFLTFEFLFFSNANRNIDNPEMEALVIV